MASFENVSLISSISFHNIWLNLRSRPMIYLQQKAQQVQWGPLTTQRAIKLVLPDETRNIGLECSHHDVTMPLLIDITPTPIDTGGDGAKTRTENGSRRRLWHHRWCRWYRWYVLLRIENMEKKLKHEDCCRINLETN